MNDKKRGSFNGEHYALLNEAIPQSGSGAHGRWVKFPDGTLITMAQKSWAGNTLGFIPIDGAGLYTSGDITIGNFPVPYVGACCCSYTIMYAGGTAQSWIAMGYPGTTGAAWQPFRIISSHNGTSVSSWEISCTAVGRWK